MKNNKINYSKINRIKSKLKNKPHEKAELKKKLLPKRTIVKFGQEKAQCVKTQELAAAYVSTRGPGSIIGDEVLDFQVRNGTGYFHFSIATSKVEC